jgi:predicted TIM-barrel fold metal-dependent hydrolase
MSMQSKWKLIAVLVLTLVILGAVGWQQFVPQPTQPKTITITPVVTTISGSQTIAQPDRIVIDTHAHLQWDPGSESSSDLAVKTALENMEKFGIQKTLIMPPPFPARFAGTYDHKELAEITKKYPGRFAVLAAGGSLNPMIHSTRPEEVTPDIKRSFQEIAEGIIRNGAVGFGETTAEHFSLHAGHPYLSAPPDHPLFLLLAEIAANNNVPIDLHMEAIPEDMLLPKELDSPPNPKTLRENMAAFERLLSYNRNARIIWAHAGWDNTGYRTVALMQQLLQRHPNLYMSIKIQNPLFPGNMPLNEKGDIRPEWVDLIRLFPDRFVIGSDTFYGVAGEVTWRTPSGETPPKETPIWVFLRKLPPDLARKVAYENVLWIYNVKTDSAPWQISSGSLLDIVCTFADNTYLSVCCCVPNPDRCTRQHRATG